MDDDDVQEAAIDFCSRLQHLIVIGRGFPAVCATPAID